ILIFSAEGYMNAEAIVPLTNSEKNIGSTVLITASEQKGTLWGTLDDSTVQGGSVIDEPGITIKLRKGLDNVSGTVYRETMTDDEGEYFFRDIEAGYYTVQVADTRTDAEEICVRTYMNVVIEGGEDKEISITVNLQEVKKEIVGGVGELQFILGWGKEKADRSIPEDLDSHLTGPTADLASRFHIYYPQSKRTYQENGVNYADLDRDDMEYEGPETTTVRISSNGIYHFYVFNYTDGEPEENDEPDYTRLSSSEAWVKIYRGTKELGVYYVPTGKIGTIWDVCTYDMNTNSLKLINNVYFHPGDSENVGMTPLDMFRENGFTLSNVTDGENDIFWHKYENDPDGNNYIYVFGENEHFGSNPEFTFRATDVTVDYRAAETVTEDVVGTLTVTFAGETRIYKVVYYDTTDAFDDIGFEAEGLFDDDKVLDLEWRKVTVDGEEVDEYFITVMGDKEPVSPNVTFKNKEDGEVTCTYDSVTGKDYVGIIHASYKHFKCDIHVYLSPKTYAFSFVMVKDADYPVEEYLYTGAMPDDQAETVDPYKYYGYINLPTVTGTVSGPSIQFKWEGVTVTSYEDLTPAEPGEPIGVFDATYGKFTCRIYIFPINLIPEAEIGTYSGEDAEKVIQWHDTNLKAAVAEELRGVASDAAIKVKDVYGITVLDISNRGITTIEDISNFRNIRYLNASNNNITTAIETIFNINSHKNVCYVDISGNKIPEDEIKDISARIWFYTHLKYEPQINPRQ
nr:hypothetical protein [Lachnospiraceae bacterium]